MSKEKVVIKNGSRHRHRTDLFEYSDDNGFIVDGTTVIFGDYGLNGKHAEEFLNIKAKFDIAFNAIDNVACGRTKGIAKAAPEDAYNPRIGIEIASRRAELASNIEAKLTLLNLSKSLNRLNAVVTAEIAALEVRKATIKRDIQELSDYAEHNATDKTK